MQPTNIQVYFQLTKIILESIYDVNYQILVFSLLLQLFFLKFPSLFENYSHDQQNVEFQTTNNCNQREQRPPFNELVK